MDLSKSHEFFKPEKYADRIHIVGCGSVGATVAEELVRSGVTRLTLWDFDVVEEHNLANQIFRQKDIGKTKLEALVDILAEINPEVARDVQLKPAGWNGQMLSGWVFLAVDKIAIRRAIVEKHLHNPNIKAMFDFRTGLTDAQHYGADWSDQNQRDALLASMDFTDEEADAAQPVSACNVTLSVVPTIRIICSLGVANFMNLWNGGSVNRMVIMDAFKPSLLVM